MKRFRMTDAAGLVYFTNDQPTPEQLKKNAAQMKAQYGEASAAGLRPLKSRIIPAYNRREKMRGNSPAELANVSITKDGVSLYTTAGVLQAQMTHAAAAQLLDEQNKYRDSIEAQAAAAADCARKAAESAPDISNQTTKEHASNAKYAAERARFFERDGREALAAEKLREAINAQHEAEHAAKTWKQLTKGADYPKLQRLIQKYGGRMIENGIQHHERATESGRYAKK